jgi:hypothetical protein
MKNKKKKLNESVFDVLLTALVMHVARKEGLKDPEFRAIISKHGGELRQISADIQQSLDKIDKMNKAGKW